MTVLHVVPSLGLRHGGVSVSVRELCFGLAREGLRVIAWTTDRAYEPALDQPADERLRAAGVELRYFPVHPWRWLGRRYAYSPALGPALAEILPQVTLAHLHAVWLYPTAIAARRCQRAGVPYLLSPCGALDPYSLRVRHAVKRLYGWAVERRTLTGASLLHFTSDLEARQAQTFGIHRPSVVIPRGVVVEEGASAMPDAFRLRHPEIGRRPIVLFLGRLHPKKRLDLVVEAFLAAARRGNDLHLVVAGPDEGAEAEARARLRQAGYTDRATFTGLLAGPDRWAVIRASALCLLPSEEENFGRAALEAMAVGVPVIVSPQVGLAEAIAQAGAGLVVPIAPAAWAAAIEQLLGDPLRCQAMGEAGRRVVAQRFTGARVAQAMRQAYDRVVQRP